MLFRNNDKKFVWMSKGESVKPKNAVPLSSMVVAASCSGLDGIMKKEEIAKGN